MTTRTATKELGSGPTCARAAAPRSGTGPTAAPPCRTHDAELWFATAAESLARAQRLCGGCPLRASCLAGAIERREPWGVWGGELFERGVPVARKRGPGRPRKDDPLHQRAAERAMIGRLAGSGIGPGDAGVAAGGRVRLSGNAGVAA